MEEAVQLFNECRDRRPSRRLNRSIAVILSLLFVTVFSSGCYVVQNDKVATEQQTGLEAYFEGQGGGFDEDAFIEDQWESEIVPFVRENAAPLQEVLSALQEDPRGALEEYGFREVEDPKNPFAVMAEGEGVVTSVNTESRAGTVEVDLLPADGEVEVILQIGPVYKGTAVRDAITFLTYGDFTNQMEWASISSAINERAGSQIFADLERQGLQGATISFAGAFSFYGSDTLEEKTPLIMPVILNVEESGESGQGGDEE